MSSVNTPVRNIQLNGISSNTLRQSNPFTSTKIANDMPDATNTYPNIGDAEIRGTKMNFKIFSIVVSALMLSAFGHFFRGKTN